MALHKSFVFDNWFCEAVSVFHCPKVACLKIVNFARSFGLAFRDEIWLVHAKHCAYMEKHELIPLDGLSPTLVSGLTLRFFAGVIDLLGIDEAFVISLSTPLFVNIELTGFSAGGSGSVLAGLGTHSSVKSKRLASAHSYGASYKKPKKPAAISGVINTFAGPLSLEDLGKADAKPAVFWGSDVGNIASSVSSLLNIENMTNLVTEETSYAESGEDDDMNEAMPRKTYTRTYALGNPMKQLLFNNVSDNNSALELPFHMLSGFNQLLPLMSCALETQSFDSTKFFTLDIELSVVPGKLISDKLISIKKIFYQIDGFGGASTPSKFLGIIRSFFTSESSLKKARNLVICENIVVNDNFRKINNQSDQEVIIKEISVDFFKSAIVADVVNWFLAKGPSCFQVVCSGGKRFCACGFGSYDLSGLLESYGGKTCFIGHNPFSYVYNQCAVICFENEASKLAAVGLIPVFKSVNLCWAGFCLAYCTQYIQFGHITANCSVDGSSGVLSSGSIDNGKPLFLVVNNLEKQLVSIKSSLVSLMGQIGEDIVMGVGSGESACNETTTATATATYTAKDSSMSLHVVKLKNMLEGLAASVLNLSARFDSLALAADILPQSPSQ
ncbi:hypothetical protein G9A89_009791 [Geosiphon pyriformis]|nr:hypothetical protein G9A89_009791 [Geosiphon pyriformis]